MGMTKHYIEIRSKCCNVKRKYVNYEEQEEIPIILQVCGCDDPRYTFDSYVWNRTYVVPIAVELYYKGDLIIHIDLSNKLFFGKPSKYQYKKEEEEYCWYFDAGNTVKYKIPAEFRNKEIKILYISESPYTEEDTFVEPAYKDKDCSVCKTPFAEVKEEYSLQLYCGKHHRFHKTCLNKRWFYIANYSNHEKDGYRYCAICHYFKKPHIYCSGGGKNNLQEFCIEYIIYNEIKVNTLPIPLQNKIKEKMSIITEDADLDCLDF